jgi:hypothetical protein
MRATVEVNQVPLVRVRRAPACEPPYDDERDPDWLDLPQPQLDLASLAPRATDDTTASPPGCGAAARPAEVACRTPAPGGEAGQAGPTARTAGPDGRPASVAAGRSHSPVRTAVGQFLRAWLEILNGYRPLTHARALANPLDATAVMAATTDAVRRFARLREGVPPTRPRLRLGRVRVFQPAPHTAEVAAVIRSHRHAWALALRLEHRQGRWLCATVDVLWGNHLADRHPT